MLFVKAPATTVPDPPGAIPVRFDVLVLVHVKIVPLTLFGFEISICVIDASEQIV